MFMLKLKSQLQTHQGKSKSNLIFWILIYGFSQSTPMRPEHIPTKTETFRPLVFNVIEPKLVEPPLEMVKQPVPTEIKFTNDSIIEKIEDALLLSEGDLRGFNLNQSKLESLLQDSTISNDKATEKLEKEKSKRKFCENKIIQLQKDIITLEENNFGKGLVNVIII